MPRLKEANKVQKRNDIVDAARKVFLHKGFEQTTIQDIANEAQMTRGNVYLYFASKDEIFGELLRHYDVSVLPDPALLLMETTSVWLLFEKEISQKEQYLLNQKENFFPVIFEYNTAAYRNQERMPQLQIRYAAAVETYEQLLRHGVEQGEFQPNLPIKAIARMLVTFMDGLGCDSLYLGAETISLKEQIAAFRLNLQWMLGLDTSKKAKEDAD